MRLILGASSLAPPHGYLHLCAYSFLVHSPWPFLLGASSFLAPFPRPLVLCGGVALIVTCSAASINNVPSTSCDARGAQASARKRRQASRPVRLEQRRIIERHGNWMETIRLRCAASCWSGVRVAAEFCTWRCFLACGG